MGRAQGTEAAVRRNNLDKFRSLLWTSRKRFRLRTTRDGTPLFPLLLRSSKEHLAQVQTYSGKEGRDRCPQAVHMNQLLSPCRTIGRNSVPSAQYGQRILRRWGSCFVSLKPFSSRLYEAALLRFGEAALLARRNRPHGDSERSISPMVYLNSYSLDMGNFGSANATGAIRTACQSQKNRVSYYSIDRWRLRWSGTTGTAHTRQ
jgi:hypothetical protein